MQNNKQRIIKRVRSKISGSVEKPRLAVFRSNKHVSAQLIDDTKGVTLVAVSDTEINGGRNATEVGKLLAQKAAKKNIKIAVFDRRAYKYHGQIKALADGARAEGLKI